MPSTKSHISFLLSLLIIWGFLVLVKPIFAQWSPPTSVPPGGSPSSFVTTGSASESKAGPLTIKSNFYVINGSGSSLIGFGTNNLTSTSSRLTVDPVVNQSIDAKHGAIKTSWYAVNADDVVNRAYLISTLDASLDPIKYWALSGNNLYASSTAWNIGIGTTNPGAKLDIVGNARVSGLLRVVRNSYPVAELVRSFDGASMAWVAKLEVVGTPAAGKGAAFLFTAPNAQGNAATSALFGGGLEVITAGSEQGYLGFAPAYKGADPTNRKDMVLLATGPNSGDSILSIAGKVGVGTTSPSEKLVVNGNTKISGNFQVSGTTNLTGAVTVPTPAGPSNATTKSYVDNAVKDSTHWLIQDNKLYTTSTISYVGIGTTNPAATLQLNPKTQTEGLRIISSNHSPLVIRNTANNADLFRVDQQGGLTAVSSSINQMFSDHYCDATGQNCFDPSEGWNTLGFFVGLTDSYNGNRGGYVSANNLCNNKVSGSHVCTTVEILNTIRNGRASDLPISSIGYWISNGPPGYTVNANDCIGYTSAASSDYGAIWVKLSANSEGYGSLRKCNEATNFACCK